MPDDEELNDELMKLLDDLERNDAAAQFQAWEQFAGKIARVAKKRMADRRESDEEDIAAKVLNSLLQRLADGRIKKPSNSGELWNLLMSMTNNKLKHDLRARHAQKRGGGKVRGESAFGNSTSSGGDGIENAAVTERDPKTAFEEAQSLTTLLESLSDEQTRQIALLKMSGHTVEEIATTLGCGCRTVQRRLSEMRKTLTRQKESD